MRLQANKRKANKSTLKKLTAIKKCDAASLEDIKTFELNHGVNLPDEFRYFLTTFNYITTYETFFEAYGNEFWLSSFYPFDKDYQPSIQSAWENLSEFFQKDYLAFADDGGGWQFVICLKEQDYGKIFFCRLDETLENALTLISNSFSEFITGLKLAPATLYETIQNVRPNGDPLVLSGQSKKAFRSGIKHFKSLAQTYKMQIQLDEAYEYGAAKIFNNNCIIDLSLDRYSSYLDIYFINPLTEKNYHYGRIMNHREVYKLEKPISYDHLDGTKTIILRLKTISTLMPKYCSDILSGDFSKVEDMPVR